MFIKNKKGQTIMEYIFLSSMIGLFCLVALKSYGSALKKRIVDLKQELGRESLIGGEQL
ncbi:MAG: hypothetical protein U0T83_02470 [Bacteriovoracaceae bacterium]